MRKPLVRLENWGFMVTRDEVFLTGEVYDHPELPNAQFITTTPIIFLTTATAESKNSIYKLGRPSPVHQKPFKEMHEALAKAALERGCKAPTNLQHLAPAVAALGSLWM